MGSNVVCSTLIGNARASVRGMDNEDVPRFFVSGFQLLLKIMALSNANPRRGGTEPPYVGFASGVSPEAQSSQTGVSVRYAQDDTKKWYVLRSSYGRASKAKTYFDKHSIECYMPLHHIIKIIDDKKKRVLAPLLPNLIFIYASEEVVKSLFDKTEINSYLSYYYDHFKVDKFGKNPPLTVDYNSMMSFIKATSLDNEHVKVVNSQYCHFKSGDKVRVIDGEFIGVEGRVARVGGQQRVIVELEGLCLIATAYIPSAFIKKIESN